MLASVVFLVSALLVPSVARLSAYFSGETWCLFDDGTIAYTAWRAMLGDLPHIGFPYFYSGGFELLLGAVFRVFGPGLYAAQWVLGITMALTAVVAFMMCVRIGLDDVVSSIVSPAMVLAASVLNFHLFPAWPAQFFVMGGILIASGGSGIPRGTGMFLAGLCFGIASALKQTSGIFAMLACVVSLVFLDASGSSPGSDGGKSTQVRALAIRTGFVVVQPAVVLVLLWYVLRTGLTAVNIVMFLAVPSIMAAFSILKTVRSCRRPDSSNASLVRANERSLLSLGAGFLIGLLPLVTFFWFSGGLQPFLNDSFLNVQEVVAKRGTAFNFLSAESLADLLVLLRRLEVFLLPPVVALGGFVYAVYRLRHADRDPSMRFLLLNSAGAALMYLTLFPNPNRVHVLFLLPMVIVPIAFAVAQVVGRWILGPSLRRICVLLLLLAVPGFYVGARYVSGSMGGMVTGSVVPLRLERGGTYVPAEIGEHVEPVVRFLEGRPATETFIGYDPYNKAIGFLAGRRIEKDYLQRHQYGEVGDPDIRDIIAACKEKKIDTVVLAKGSLHNTEGERDLFSCLDRDFIRTLDTPYNFVFQRRSADGAEH